MKKLIACALLFAALPASAMSSKTPITADQIQQHARTAAAIAQIFACDVSTVANIALVAELAANSGGQVVRTGTTTKVVNVSMSLCAMLGGVASTVAVSSSK
jgi:hypothetical protein